MSDFAEDLADYEYDKFQDACAHFDDIVWQYVRSLNLQGLSVAECIKEGERLQTKYKEKRDLANKKPFADYQ
jgi:hypothetical protein